MPETYSTPPVYTPAELVELLGPEGSTAIPKYLAPLHMLVPLIKHDIGPIGKSGQMTGSVQYKFRSIEDILNEAHSVLVTYGVRWRKSRILSHELRANGKAQECVMTIEYIFTGPLGDTETTVAVGQAVDFGSDKATNKADTAARKNMLVDWLALATEDPDNERPDRVDERPQVQPAGIERFTEVFNSIGPLSDTSKAMVKEYAEAQGISLAKKDWEAMTRADHTKMKAFIAARAKADEATAVPAPPTMQEGLPITHGDQDAYSGDPDPYPMPAEEPDADRTVTMGAFKTQLAKVVAAKDVNPTVEGLNLDFPLTRDDANAAIAMVKRERGGSVTPPKRTEALSDESVAKRGDLIERLEKLPAEMQRTIGAEIEKKTGGIGLPAVLIAEAPAGEDQWLKSVILSFEGALVSSPPASDEEVDF